MLFQLRHYQLQDLLRQLRRVSRILGHALPHLAVFGLVENAFRDDVFAFLLQWKCQHQLKGDQILLRKGKT